jgi:hypothetical protein
VKCAKSILSQGFSSDLLILQYCDLVLKDSLLSDFKKALIFEKIAQCDKALKEGGDNQL